MSSSMWRDRFPTLDPGHHVELESRAAIRELADGVPPRQAEEQAHEEYVRQHLTRAAAHHLAGVRAAHVVGDMEEAARHSLRYGVMARALGYDPQGEPPPEVAALARDPEHTKVYGFKPHDADAMLLNHLIARRGLRKAEGDEQPSPIAGALVRDEGGTQTWDLSHLLPRMRQDASERLLVCEGPTGRTAHHLRDEAGRQVPLAALAETEGGPEDIAGGRAADDVRRAADLGFRLRRAAQAASIADRVRQAAQRLEIAG